MKLDRVPRPGDTVLYHSYEGWRPALVTSVEGDGDTTYVSGWHLCDPQDKFAQAVQLCRDALIAPRIPWGPVTKAEPGIATGKWRWPVEKEAK